MFAHVVSGGGVALGPRASTRRLRALRRHEPCVHTSYVALVIDETVYEIEYRRVKGWSQLHVLVASEF